MSDVRTWMCLAMVAVVGKPTPVWAEAPCTGEHGPEVVRLELLGPWPAPLAKEMVDTVRAELEVQEMAICRGPAVDDRPFISASYQPPDVRLVVGVIDASGLIKNERVIATTDFPPGTVGVGLASVAVELYLWTLRPEREAPVAPVAEDSTAEPVRDEPDGPPPPSPPSSRDAGRGLQHAVGARAFAQWFPAGLSLYGGEVPYALRGEWLGGEVFVRAAAAPDLASPYGAVAVRLLGGGLALTLRLAYLMGGQWFVRAAASACAVLVSGSEQAPYSLVRSAENRVLPLITVLGVLGARWKVGSAFSVEVFLGAGGAARGFALHEPGRTLGAAEGLLLEAAIGVYWEPT